MLTNRFPAAFYLLGPFLFGLVTTDFTNWIPGSTYNATNIVPVTSATTEVTRSGDPRETIVIRDNTPMRNTPMRNTPMRVMRVKAYRP